MRRVRSLLLVTLFVASGCMTTMYCDQYHLLSIPARCDEVAITLREDRLAKLHEQIRAQELDHLFVLPHARPYPFDRIPLTDINVLLDLMSQPQNSGRDRAIARCAGSAAKSIAIFAL